MNQRYVIRQLESNRGVFKDLLNQITEEEYLWRPATDKWCILEIVCHLLDEEHEDFRARVKITLEDPKQELVPTDPIGWVKSRHYINKGYQETLENFLAERDMSIKWLKTLTEAKWDNVLTHPKLGDMSAFQILANWLAHDYLHLRQLIRYKYQYLNSGLKLDLGYAGNW